MRLTNFGDWDQINAFYNALRAVEVDDAITTPSALVVIAGRWAAPAAVPLVAEGASRKVAAVDSVPREDGFIPTCAAAVV